MERCLDCNCVLAVNEKACPLCGKTLPNGKASIAELSARAGTLIFYGSIIALIVSRFSSGYTFAVVLALCTAVLMLTMWKKTR
jgi:hypothetical protein